MLFSTFSSHQRYTAYLLFIAGTGGLLYGIDVGIIAGALPYLESTASMMWHLTAQQLGFVVAAVLLGSVLSSLLAGTLADLIGRRATLVLAGALFCASIPVIAMASGYVPLLLGRMLQGISGGLIGVVVPLYLAECLSPSLRGRGTALFQLLLTLGLVFAALIGLYYAHEVELVTSQSDDVALFAVKDHAWRSIFWFCLVPGLAFTIGLLNLSESPRWLARRGHDARARAALLRSLTAIEAEAEWRDIVRLAQKSYPEGSQAGYSDRLLSRRYVYPFLLACLILAFNQTTGINSILAYSVKILSQAGLPGSIANLGDVGIKVVNALVTIIALILVDRKGRKFLLMVGSGGIVISLMLAGTLFLSVERDGTDVRDALQTKIQNDALVLTLDAAALQSLGIASQRADDVQITVAYSYGEFTNVVNQTIVPGNPSPVLRISRATTVEEDSVLGRLFRRMHLNPFPDPLVASMAPLHLERATVDVVPPQTHGWLVAACIFGFIASYAIGPGVCVWLALSELMPTRIRSNGMSIALLINQFISTVIAAMFLPTVGTYGYSYMFYFWAACSILYFLTALFLLPETKGKTLEEIEAQFAR